MTSDPLVRPTPSVGRILVVGQGRMGRALVTALEEAGEAVTGPAGRGSDGDGAQVVLLAVPDDAVAEAAGLIAPGRIVGHLSGAQGLDVLCPHERFSVHPLMTVTDEGAPFAGASAAVDGSTVRAMRRAEQIAAALGMSPFVLREEDRVAYHAAASIASNFLVTLEGVAERLASTAGVGREALIPLVRATVENWALHSARDALTGPVARGDVGTVARQRHAIEQRMPESLPLFDALAEATAALASTHPLEEDGTL